MKSLLASSLLLLSLNANAYVEDTATFYNRLSDADKWTLTSVASNVNEFTDIKMKWKTMDSRKFEMNISGLHNNSGKTCKHYRLFLDGYQAMGEFCKDPDGTWSFR
jgi:hypothetical protein